MHGNPTWSYTFRSVIAALSPTLAGDRPDHLGMGYSERTGETHRLADRIDELQSLTEALDVAVRC